MEELIAGTWAKVLALPDVGIDDISSNLAATVKCRPGYLNASLGHEHYG
jgi:hypothetical protein